MMVDQRLEDLDPQDDMYTMEFRAWAIQAVESAIADIRIQQADRIADLEARIARLETIQRADDRRLGLGEW